MLSGRNDNDDTCHNLVPRTGANRQALDASGTGYFTVHTHANQHAGYFPGAKPVHILMHVGADGQIRGAQAVGADDVDRRIDVIATAMRAGLGLDQRRRPALRRHVCRGRAFLDRLPHRAPRGLQRDHAVGRHPDTAGVARREGRGRAGHGGGLSLRILATKTTRCRSARQ